MANKTNFETINIDDFIHDPINQEKVQSYPPELVGRFNSFIVTAFDDSMTVEMQIRTLIKWIKENIDVTTSALDNMEAFKQDSMAFQNHVKNTLVNLINQFTDKFDDNLKAETLEILNQWFMDGLLSDLVRDAINEEVINARGGKDSLGERLDETDDQLAHISHLPSQFKNPQDVDDTASINRALSYVNSLGGGKVRIPYRNTPYILSSALIIFSNTHLEVDTYAVIKLADDVNVRMVENANKTTNANLTRIDKNIKITGGIWDGNGTKQSKKWDGEATTTTLMTGFLFSGVDKLEFKPTKIINTKTYGALICNVNDLLIENVEVYVGDVNNPNNGDGIHVLGPAENITIQNCKIHSEDNVIAINADDIGHGPYGTFGNISNVLIKDIYINNHDGGQGMLLLSANHSVKNVLVENITGEAAYLMNLSTFDFGPGDYNNITIRNANIKRINPDIWAQGIMICGKFGTVDIKDITFSGNENTIDGTQGVAVFTRPGTPVTSVGKLTIENLNISGVSGSSSFKEFDMVIIAEFAYVNQLTVKGLVSKYNTIKCIPVDLIFGVVDNAEFSDFTLENAPEVLKINNATVGKALLQNVILDNKSVNRINHINGTGSPLVKELKIVNCGLINVTAPSLIEIIIIDGRITSLFAPSDDGYYRAGQIVHSANPLSLGYAGWVCTANGSPYNVAREANKAYNIGDVVRIGDWLVKCVVAGTSASSQPTVTVTDFYDGTVMWRYMYDGIATFSKFGAIV